MPWETIRKDAPPRVAPNLRDYDKECADFSWQAARSRLEGLPGGRGLNIAHEAVDRHVASGHATAVALRCVGRDDSVTSVTYGELARSTARFANVLRGLGVGHGDRVVTLLGRCLQLYTVVLGTLKNTGVLCPLFSAFGPDPVFQRMTLGDAQVLVTTADLFRRKVAARHRGLATLRYVLIVGDGADELPGTLSLDTLMADAADHLHHPADIAPRHGPVALHERHDGGPQGRGARARGGRSPLHDRAVRPRPP
ncbi:AMP-binding protein [Streptomyces sp. NBC_01689]|uniref:AMP-binding protein n=2 Tax=unclassified Streptomyces TaxID=2593676 RepID=UPI002E32AA3B|nr:AMP-binding protein [Streptomyces sp. NBC_01689]